MKSKRRSQFAGLAVFALLLPAAIFAEEQPAERGSIEFGVRHVWGDVYGRPDLQLGPSVTGNPLAQPGCLGCGPPFDPLLRTSKYEEYRDLRNGFFIRRFNGTFDNLLGSKNYVSLQSQKTLYRDQSYLATFGQYGKFKIQFRYDEIPHVYSNTTRTLFTETSPGVWSFPTLVRQTLQATPNGVPTGSPNLIPSVTNTQAVPQFNFLTPSIVRKAGTVLVSYNVTPDFNLNGLFWRESQNGLRPIGLILNSSPSASASAGYGVELPETISYFNNLVRVGGEYGKQSWAVQAAYIGSFFQNNIGQMLFDNPFNLNLVGASTPQRGQVDLYPDNQAHYVNVAAATDVGKWLRLMASVNPGWLRQNDAFLPYTTNTALTGCGDGGSGTQACTAPPAAVPSLNGDKQTLAMNYTLVTLPWKRFQVKATYRHYDYNNNTPVHTFTPTQGDVALPTLEDNQGRATSFNRKNLELTGNWYFAKRSSVKVGYEAEWMDRLHRDAEHSLENSIFAAADLSPIKDLLFRVSYRHSDRKPDVYQDETATDAADNLVPCTGPNSNSTDFTEEQRCHRRFDEAARIRNRADGLIQYSPTSKLSLSAFGGTIQDDYNRPETNSPTPLNFPGATVNPGPYFLYGILKDISYNYGFGADYAVSPHLSLFAEYLHEHYYRRLISRYRAPAIAATSSATGCGPNSSLPPATQANRGACDSGNNDWQSTTPELVDIWTAGTDIYIGKKAYFTTYYSLSAGRANTFSQFLGDPVGHPNAPLANDPDRFMLVGTTAAGHYPESVSRQHEVVAIFKYKLSKNLWPKVEYRYQQFDNRDYQTTPMTQYMGCVSGVAAPGAVTGCPVPMLTSAATSAFPTFSPSPFYPSFVVGDTSAARYLFLGVDQPSYRAHYVAATIEYHF